LIDVHVAPLVGWIVWVSNRRVRSGIGCAIGLPAAIVDEPGRNGGIYRIAHPSGSGSVETGVSRIVTERRHQIRIRLQGGKRGGGVSMPLGEKSKSRVADGVASGRRDVASGVFGAIDIT